MAKKVRKGERVIKNSKTVKRKKKKKLIRVKLISIQRNVRQRSLKGRERNSHHKRQRDRNHERK